MRKRLRMVLSLMAAVLAVVSCDRGGRVIPVRKMERIYREMLLADQWLAENPDRRDRADTTWFYEPIFEKYGFTTKDYQKSVGHYLNDPKRYAEMMSRVEKGLRKEMAAINDEMAREDRLQNEADSIVRVWKSVKAKPFTSFLDVFEVDAMTDRIEFEKDSLDLYRPVPVVEDTVYHGPCLVIRDTTVRKTDGDSLSVKNVASPERFVSMTPIVDDRPEKSVKRLQLTPAKDILLEYE